MASKTPLICNLNTFLAAAIKTLRQRKGLSQNALAELSSMDRTHISLIERGKRSLTISSLEKLIPSLSEHTLDFSKNFAEQIEIQCCDVQSKKLCAVINGEIAHCHLVGKPFARVDTKSPTK